MIPREILKKIRQIELRTNRSVTELAGGHMMSRETLCDCRPLAICLRMAGTVFICVLLLATSGCKTTPPPAPLPPVTTFNWGAGCGDLLLVKLRIEDSEEGWFVLDTGCPVTVVSKSLEQKLGKPVGRQKIQFPWYPDGKSVATKYSWPKLSLAGAPMRPGKFVVVTDTMNSGPKGHRYAGVLGMDCLQHYCVQLDFDKRTIRFLSSAELNTNVLGRAYPLAYFHSLPPFRSATPQYPFPFSWTWGSLFAKTELLDRTQWCQVDTGDYADGSLNRVCLKRAEKLQPAPIRSTMITNETLIIRGSLLPVYSLGGHQYTNVVMHSRPDSDENVLGLRLLARNLVTFDFPGRTMYLKQRHIGPLALYSDREKEAFQTFIKARKQNGGLPGLDKDAKGMLFAELGYEPETYSFRATGEQTADATSYYQFRRAADEGEAWVLRRAWRMDQNHKVVEEYSVP